MHCLNGFTARLYAGFTSALVLPYGALTDRRTILNPDANDTSATCPGSAPQGQAATVGRVPSYGSGKVP